MNMNVNVVVNLPNDEEGDIQITCRTLRLVQRIIDEKYPEWTSYVLTVTREK